MSPIGQGRVDPRTLRNQPYTIAGEPVAGHLSRLFPSRVDLAVRSCPDLRAGCGT